MKRVAIVKIAQFVCGYCGEANQEVYALEEGSDVISCSYCGRDNKVVEWVEGDRMVECCKSCGVPLASHLGIEGTCEENLLLRVEIARLRLRLKELEQERANRKKYMEDWR